MELLEKNKIHRGDTFELLDGIEDGSVDLLLTDPPYNVSVKGSDLAYGDRKTGMDFGDWDYGFDTEAWMRKVVTKMHPERGQVVIFNSFKNIELMARVLEEYGYTIHGEPQYWYKPNPIPHLPTRLPVNSLEQILWATRGNDWVFNVREGHEYEAGRHVHSPHAEGNKRFHTTQKPLKMFKDIIKIHTNPGDFVLDTFSGSGVTIAGCEELRRDCIAFEQDAIYFDKSTERHEKVKNKVKSLWI